MLLREGVKRLLLREAKIEHLLKGAKGELGTNDVVRDEELMARYEKKEGKMTLSVW